MEVTGRSDSLPEPVFSLAGTTEITDQVPASVPWLYSLSFLQMTWLCVTLSGPEVGGEL